MDNDNTGLSLAQEFQLKRIADDTEKLNITEARTFIVELTRQAMVKDNLFKNLLQQKL